MTLFPYTTLFRSLRQILYLAQFVHRQREMPGGVPLLQHRRLNHKERLVTRKSGDVEAHPLQERLVKDDIDQVQMFRGAVPVRTRPVVHKNITCFDWKLLFPDDVDPVTPRDDDDLQ
jgi:hypothetical protein